MSEQDQYFNSILQEYNAKVSQLEHEIIMLKVENNRLKRQLEEKIQENNITKD